jgi:hypothetical protein
MSYWCGECGEQIATHCIHGSPAARDDARVRLRESLRYVAVACLTCGASVGTEHTKHCINNRAHATVDNRPRSFHEQGLPEGGVVVDLEEESGRPDRVCTCGAGSDEDCGGPHDHIPPCPAAGPQASSLKPQAPARRLLAYMMHPLGNGTNREYNRRSACHWQAVIQEAHPEWLVLAPWIGLSGAWSEARRELGMQTDFATIDVCDIGVIAGPLDGPKDFHVTTGRGSGIREALGVSPGMSDELNYFNKEYPEKMIYDVRQRFKIELPPLEGVVRGERVPMPPRFSKFEQVLVENKPGGVCHIKQVEEQALGCYRYLIERTETFFAHEQSLARAEHPLEVPPLPSLKNL